jgi:hypothetical protein
MTIEGSILNLFTTDSALIGILGMYQTVYPKIFLDSAPEDCTLNYVVFSVNFQDDDGGSQDMTLSVDFQGFNQSRAIAGQAMERVEFLLDYNTIESDDYGGIHFRRISGPDYSPGDDTRNMRYQSIFWAQGMRKKWLINTR